MKEKQKSALMIGAGILILLFAMSSSIGRSGVPKYDGDTDQFSITIKDHSERAEVGDTYNIQAQVHNEGDTNGHMFVQCSILDRAEQTWIPAAQSVIDLGTDNCVPDEAFSQTAEVSLEGEEYAVIDFTVRVPNNIKGDNVIYCDAFEQCHSVDENSYESDRAIVEIDIVAKDEKVTNDNSYIVGENCVEDSNCKNGFFTKSVCDNGRCVDKEASSINFSDSSIKGWASENKIILIVLGVFLLLVGIMSTYKEKKIR